MIDVKKLMSEHNIVDVISEYVHLDKKGTEYIGMCPFHEDDKPSLMVNESKQIFKCFACGGPDGKGGDVIHFLTGMGATFHEACKKLQDGKIIDESDPEKRQPKQSRPKPVIWNQVVPAPKLLELPIHYIHGVASAKWTYHNKSSEIVGYICRFDLEDGSKQVLPYIFAENNGREEWRWQGFDKPRPLYNLTLLIDNPSATIIVVEGEKTADAVQNELNSDKTVVVTWIGGANGINNTDFSPLHGRKVVFWPDHDISQKYGKSHPKAGEVKQWFDQPGNHAMLEINSIIKNKCIVRKWVHVPDDFPDKWDGADKEWKPDELRQFLIDKMVDVPLVENLVGTTEKEIEKASAVEKKEVAAPVTPEPPVEAPIQSPENNAYFRMLGFDHDDNMKPVYYFFSFDSQSTIKLSPSSMTKSYLISIAPINFWEKLFPASKSKIDIDAAQEFLMRYSHKVGPFREKSIRGRGAWVDEGKIVIHTGNELIVEGKTLPLKDFKSKFVYEIGEKLGIGGNEPLRSLESKKLIDLAKWLKWERAINAYLMIGWCVISPFCGILNWRPHIWVTGPAGSGKSWTMEKILKRLLGESAVVVQGKTTEPGIRGMLRNDARPVLFDEIDADSHHDRERIQSIIASARSASHSDGGVVGKGTQSGSSRTYTMRSCYALCSIGVQLNQQSDRSRFTMLGLMSFEKFKTKEDFVDFEIEWNKLVTDEYIQMLQSRTIKLLPTILKNSTTFADAVSHHIGQRRIGDQVGGMLAGAYSLISDKEISYEQALEWVQEDDKDWTEEKGLEQTKDEYQLFAKIMGHSLTVETNHGRTDLTVGELILVSAGLVNEFGLSSEGASKRLRRIGIIVKDEQVLISNGASGIKDIIKNTSWSNNHSKILMRLDGAEKVDPRVYYPGYKSRGVSLPLEMISEGYDDIIKIAPELPLIEGKQDDLPF